MRNILFCACIALLFIGCNEDDASPADHGLVQQWELSNGGYVMVDNIDMTADYHGFAIDFQEDANGNVFLVTNGGLAFPQAVDTWSYTDDSKTAIVRGSDNVEIRISLENPETLDLSFTINTPAGGRVAGTVGDFVFRLSKI